MEALTIIIAVGIILTVGFLIFKKREPKTRQVFIQPAEPKWIGIIAKIESELTKIENNKQFNAFLAKHELDVKRYSNDPDFMSEYNRRIVEWINEH